MRCSKFAANDHRDKKFQEWTAFSIGGPPPTKAVSGQASPDHYLTMHPRELRHGR